MNRGRWVILVMLLIGLVLASVSVVVHYRQGRRSLAYWGKDDGLLIRDAESVLLVRLRPASIESTADGQWTVGGQTWAEDKQLDVTHRIGILHVRMALLDDKSYDWQATPAACETDVLHALSFQSGARHLEVILDTKCRQLRSADGQRRNLSIAPAAEFFSDWIQEQMPQE